MIRLLVNHQATLQCTPSALARDILSKFTINNPAYVSAEKQGRWTKNIEPMLYFAEQTSDGLTFPRGATADVHAMAKRHGPVEVIDRRLSLPDIDLKFSGRLREYQKNAVDGQLLKTFGVLESGTGSGKTVMAAAIIATRKQPTLILVHSKELMYQWRDRLREFLGIEVGLVGDGRCDIQPVTLAIVNTARKKLDILSNRFGHVVVDECHRCPSTMFTEVLKAMPCMFQLGLSATPYRRDGLDPLIGWFVGIHRVKIPSDKLKESVLSPSINAINTSFDYWYEDDYPNMISAMIIDRNRNQLIASHINQQAKQGGIALVVSDRVGHLNRLAELVDAPYRILTGRTSKKQRSEIVAEVRSGVVSILFSTTSLIGEGFDVAGLDSLFLTTPIRFSGRLKQVVGRILRPAAGKRPVVFDFVDRPGILANQARARQIVYKSLRGSYETN